MECCFSCKYVDDCEFIIDYKYELGMEDTDTIKFLKNPKINSTFPDECYHYEEKEDK